MYVHSARCPPQAKNTITLRQYNPQELTPKTTDLRGERGCRNKGAQRGREEHFHELTGLRQKELYGGCGHEWAASEVV